MLLNCGVGETLESPLDYKEIQPTHSRGNQSWIFFGRIDTEAETPILWLPDVKNWLTGKDPDAGKDEGRRRRGQQRMRWLGGITNSMDWIWVSSGTWWWTGKPGVLQSMGLQRVRHDWAAELNCTEYFLIQWHCDLLTSKSMRLWGVVF